MEDLGERRVVALYYLEGRSYEEISTTLHIPVNSIGPILTRARKKLRQAAFGQAKVQEASVVVVACGDPQGWKDADLEEMLKLAEEHGFTDEAMHDTIRKNVANFLGGLPGKAGGVEPTFDLWVNRHVMIAFTTIMWMAEALGYDTAPMEGFMEDQVKQLLHIPDRVRVVALLSIGRRKGSDKPYGGRFDPSRTVFADEWGKKLW